MNKPQARKALPPLLLMLLLSACSKYQLTLNDQVMYTPPPLFTHFSTEDLNLRNCLDQAIKDQKVTQPAQLTLLDCSNAGVTSIKGLEIFSGLKQINLAHNQLQDIAPLAAMTDLEVLVINHNQLKSAAALLNKPRLARLDMSDNPALDCDAVSQLATGFTGELRKPKQCQ